MVYFTLLCDCSKITPQPIRCKTKINGGSNELCFLAVEAICLFLFWTLGDSISYEYKIILFPDRLCYNMYYSFFLQHSIKGHALSYLLWPSSLSWIIFFRRTTIAINIKIMMPTTIKMMKSIFHEESTSICPLRENGVSVVSVSVEWNLKQLTSRKWGEVLIGSLDWHVHCFEPNRGHYFVPLPLPSLMLLAKKIQSRSLSLHSPTKQPNFWALKSFMFMWHFVYDNHEMFRYTITPMSKIESSGSHHVSANFYVTYWPKINWLRRNI